MPCRAQLRGMELLVGACASRWQKRLTKAEYTYLRKGLKKIKSKLAKFYTTIKVHKYFHTLRPISSGVLWYSCFGPEQLARL